MLNIGKLTAVDGVNYYLSQVASGVEDYYTGQGEATGYWTGSAASGLELEGEVRGDDLRAILAGLDPRAPEHPLGSWKSGRTVLAFDVVFRAPKSVSVLWGLSDMETAGIVRAAHDAAVQAALAYLEDAAAWSRRGAGGHESVQGDGLVAAAFRHRTSRAGDPLLHTHLLVANMTRTADDGRWRTLDSRRGIYAHAKTAGYLYQAQLRHELTRTLGVAWHRVTNGYADIDGIDAGVLQEFSQRRRAIVQRMTERGESSARAAQAATLDTRRPKQNIDGASLTERWAARAAEHGLDADDLTDALHRRSSRPLDPQAIEQACAAMAGPNGATQYASMFTRRDVVQFLCGTLDAGADTEDILAATDRAIAQEPVVALRKPPDANPAADRHRRRYSTAELLRTERRIITTAQRRKNSGTAVAFSDAIDDAITRRPTLRAEQVTLVRRLCADGDGVAVVVGKAGTGKTFALDAARDAWQASQFHVTGCALAGQAARQLADATGIICHSVKSLLNQLEGPDPRARLGTRNVLLVDEAGMVGTRYLGRLNDLTAAAGAKLVLIGDHRQLPEIHAGGAFAALATRLDPIELHTNRRQREGWEREALEQLRDGAPTVAIGAYRRRGRLTVATTAEDVRETLVGDWWTAWTAEGPTSAVMVALRVSDVEDLNARARERMAATDRLTGPTLTLDNDVAFQTGDRAVLRRGGAFTASDGRSVRLENGHRGTVTCVSPSHCDLVMQVDAGPAVTVPTWYLAAGHLDHGYAITGHRAQGLTTERCYVLGSDALYREWGYTAMSRGRTANNLYVVTADLDDIDNDLDIHGVQRDERHPVTQLASWITRSKAQQLALSLTDGGHDLTD